MHWVFHKYHSKFNWPRVIYITTVFTIIACNLKLSNYFVNNNINEQFYFNGMLIIMTWYQYTLLRHSTDLIFLLSIVIIICC